MNKKMKMSLVTSVVALGGMALVAPAVNAHTHDKHDKMKHETKEDESLFNNHITKKFKTETAQVGEHTISYEIYKSKGKVKKTYVLSHGASGTGEYMKVLAKELIEKEPHSRVIIVDLPLHGNSTGPMNNINDIDVHFYTDIMYDFLEQKTKDKTIQGKVNWTGWSMGGSIGLLLDLKGANIDELTLVNSAPVWQGVEPLLPMFESATMKNLFKSIVEADLSVGISDKDKVEVLNHYDVLSDVAPEIMVQDFYAVAPTNYDVREQLDKIKAKTLIVSSTNDIVSNIGVQELMDEQIEESKLVVYEGETHLQLVKPVQAEKMVEEMVAFYK